MAGINVVITRKEICEDDIIPLFRRFNFNKKIKIIALPTIITIPINSTEISDTIKKIERGYYHYYIFASSHAVNIFFETIKQHKSCNIIQNLIKLSENNSTTNNCFIAIGPKTKKELEKNGIKAILAAAAVSDDESSTTTNINNNYDTSINLDSNNRKGYSIDRIIEFLDEKEEEENEEEEIRILMPRSSESLKSKNFITKIYRNVTLDQVFFYETREFENAKESIEWKKFNEIISKKEEEEEEETYIIFTSPSTVRAFFNILSNNFITEKKENGIQLISNTKKEKELLSNLVGIRKIISLGPKTSQELKQRDISFIESNEHTIKGALNQLLQLIGGN